MNGQPETDTPTRWFPPRPRSVEETGLKRDDLVEYILKTLYVRGTLTGAELEDSLKLPYLGVLEEAMRFLRDEAFVEVRRGITLVELHWEFFLTQKGMERAESLMERQGYVGPAPVPYEKYLAYFETVSPPRGGIDRDRLKTALRDLVFPESLFDQLGPALNAGRPVFLYGPPGTGKTSIAERIARVRGGDLWIPYALRVHGHIVRLFDPLHHDPLPLSEEELSETVDLRWVRVRRPFIMVGGELTLKSLELQYEQHSKTYVSPIHMKANGGILLVDDFGRQRVPPRDLLNRWIVPLEKERDFFTLQTGEQITVPFKMQLIFSTNLRPEDLVDEAFLRRIPYRVYVPAPTEALFKEIFRRVCTHYGVPYDAAAVDRLIEKHYRSKQRPFRASHPRDLVLQILEHARFLGVPPSLSDDLMDRAAENYLGILDHFREGGPTLA
ncbi:MAG: AAA family ATPase [Candidatus Hydrothermae bacterium]|nr:AAA family ATPase [Candidatus Hydrothermae bacterium]